MIYSLVAGEMSIVFANALDGPVSEVTNKEKINREEIRFLSDRIPVQLSLRLRLLGLEEFDVRDYGNE